MTRPLRICARPGCNTVTRSRHCNEHAVNLNKVYGRRWREHIRPAVLATGRCHYCKHPGTPEDPLHAAHLDETEELVRQGRDVYDTTRIAPAHASCHNQNAPHLNATPSALHAARANHPDPRLKERPWT